MSEKEKAKKSRQGKSSKEMDRFIAVARELGCDESPETFIAAMKTVAKARPTTNDAIRNRKKKK